MLEMVNIREIEENGSAEIILSVIHCSHFSQDLCFLLPDMQRKSNHLLCDRIVEISRNCGVFLDRIVLAVRCAFTLIVNRDHRPDSSQPNVKRMKCRNRKKTVFRSREAIIPNASGTGREAKGMMIIIKNSVVGAAAAIDNVRFFCSCSTEFHTFFLFFDCFFSLLLFKLFSFPVWTIVAASAIPLLFPRCVVRITWPNLRLHSASASVHISYPFPFYCARFAYSMLL